MKLKDAIYKMNPGDEFVSDDGSTAVVEKTTLLVWKNKDKNLVRLSVNNLDLEGEIIRAEPEVLTAEDWLRNGNDYPDRVDCYNAGDKNGQIKEWKRLKPLIDAVRNLHDELHGPHIEPISFDKVFSEIKNLTPPWEPEK